MSKAALAVGLALASASAVAADKEGKFAALGGGQATCARFLEAREAKSREYYLFGGWIDGYISALNQTQPETFTLVPWQSSDLLAASLASFCRKQPDQFFIHAVAAMVQAIKRTA